MASFFMTSQSQRLIRVRRPGGERIPVIELHLYRPQVHLRPGVFGLKAQHDTFVRMDRHRQTGRLPIESGLSGKQLMRHAAELDDNFRSLPGKPLPGAEVERHALPAPVVEEQPERDKCLGLRIRRHPVFFAVTRNSFASEPTLALLPTDDALMDGVSVNRTDGVGHIHFLVANLIGIDETIGSMATRHRSCIR